MFGENEHSNVESSFKEPKKKGSCLKILLIFLLIGSIAVLVVYGLFRCYQYLDKKMDSDKKVESTQIPEEQEQEEAEDQKTEEEKSSNQQDDASAANTEGDSGATGKVSSLMDVSDVVSAVMPAVVSITNVGTEQYRDFFGQTYEGKYESSGSGIIIGQNDKELYIVTNNHVVEGASTISVGFVDDSIVEAQVKGTDSYVDLAVLTIQLKDISEDTLNAIKVARLGNSDKLKVGEPAIAIGNALGYGQSVTTGVISALSREVTVDSVTNELIQTDAAINPGNSGGALLNLKGEVIGINSIKYASAEVEGMGYAIPTVTAEPIINDLINKTKVESKDAAYLGIAGVDVTEEASQTYDMPVGIFVAKVLEGTAAEKAGLKKGDIIVKIDNKEVATMAQLSQVLEYYAADKTVDVVIRVSEDGEYVERTISVTLGRKK